MIDARQVILQAITPSNTAIAASDSMEIAAGKAQGQITALLPQTITFTAAIPFNKPVTVMNKVVTGPIAFTVDTTNAVAGYGTIARLQADATNIPTFSTTFNKLSTSDIYDNTAGRIHIISFFYDGTDYNYSISQQQLKDVTAPTLSTAVITSAAPTIITLTYSETLDTSSVPATTDFTVSGGKTVSSVSISANQVFITVNSAYAGSDTITISYTGGTNKIRDLVGNNAANLSSQSVTNSIAFLSFPTVTGLTNTSNVWQGSITGTYQNTGLSNQSLPANTDGFIYFQYVATDGRNAILGFNTTNANQAFANYEAGVFISATTNNVHKVDSGTATTTGVASVIGNYYRLSRVGSVIKIDTSSDTTTWTNIVTLTFSSTAILYINLNIDTTNKCYYPKGVNVV